MPCGLEFLPCAPRGGRKRGRRARRERRRRTAPRWRRRGEPSQLRRERWWEPYCFRKLPGAAPRICGGFRTPGSTGPRGGRIPPYPLPPARSRSLSVESALGLSRRDFAAIERHGFEYTLVPEGRLDVGFLAPVFLFPRLRWLPCSIHRSTLLQRRLGNLDRSMGSCQRSEIDAGCLVLRAHVVHNDTAGASEFRDARRRPCGECVDIERI